MPSMGDPRAQLRGAALTDPAGDGRKTCNMLSDGQGGGKLAPRRAQPKNLAPSHPDFGRAGADSGVR